MEVTVKRPNTFPLVRIATQYGTVVIRPAEMWAAEELLLQVEVEEGVVVIESTGVKGGEG